MMFRLDRLITLALYRYLPKSDSSKKQRIPILMYHSISDEKEEGVHPYYRTITTPEVFSKQMSFLAENGYQVIELERAVEILSGNNSEKELHDKSVVITFDDGFSDFYSDAFPILDNHGFKATVFLPTSFIGCTDRSFMGRSFLNWLQVRDLLNSGITFGSHSVSHKYLVKLTKEQVKDELRVSKETIEQETGREACTFSYPYAYPENDKEFDLFMRGAIRSCGYIGAVTTRIGTVLLGDDPFCLKRIPVNNDDDAKLFHAKLTGEYDWLHTLQYLAKSAKSKLRMGRHNVLTKWEDS